RPANADHTHSVRKEGRVLKVEMTTELKGLPSAQTGHGGPHVQCLSTFRTPPPHESLQRRRFPSNCPQPSSMHLSCHTSPCPSVDPGANWAIIISLISSCGCSTQGCSGRCCAP